MSDNTSIKTSEGKLPFTVRDFVEKGGTFQYTTYKDLTNVINYDDTSNVTNTGIMFQGCASLTTVPLFDTSKVTNMSGMFYQCLDLTSVPLFDTSRVTNMESMFYRCHNLIIVPAFDVSKVTDMHWMLDYCHNLEEIHMKNIGANLDIHYSTKFTREALVEIIGNLQKVASKRTLTMGKTNLMKLTDEDKAVATSKGWLLK